MNVVVVRDQHRPHLGGNLNIRQLLNPLFYDGAWLRPLSKHPDRKRQRKARLKALALHQARSLKAMEVPLRLVDRTIYPRRGTTIWAGENVCRPGCTTQLEVEHEHL